MILTNGPLLLLLVPLLSCTNAWVPTAIARSPWQRCMTASSTTDACPKVGDVVTIDCRLTPEGDFVPEPLIDGVILDDNEPSVQLDFVLGEGGYLPGLHDIVAGLQPGESVENVSLDAGWGSRNPDLVVQVSFEQSGLDRSQIQIGSELFLANGAKCVVTDVSEETFTIDANPPLAGASYTASIKLLRAEPGPTITEYSHDTSSSSRFQVATFALGCFWGGELHFMRQAGVVGTSVGYTQGSQDNPTYEQVCSGTTGHTEAIVVKYDPNAVAYGTLVDSAMDRLGENKYLLNQVGNDQGTQYRHGVYYHNNEQRMIAEQIVSSYEDCVTEVLPATKFWSAEDYHQQYLLKGGQSARKGDKSVIRCYG